MKNKIAYAYFKGVNYKTFSFLYEGDDEVKEVRKDFNTIEELVGFMISFSDYYSIPVQIYE